MITHEKTELIAFERMKSSIKLVDDHFQLPLLWRNEDEELPNNFEMAKGRLASLKRKLKKNEDLLQRYNEVLEGYVTDGYTESISESEIEQEKKGKVWYLPHHGVVNPKPNKLRIVFDCAAEYQGTSLIHRLLQGPTMTNNLSGVLLCFREH